MSTLLHSGQHLTADLVSAYVDAALPEPERLQAVAHLSVCPSCREIVLLVQQADLEDIPPPAPTPQRTPFWRRWLTVHPLLGVASAAFASVVVTSTAFVAQHEVAKKSAHTQTAHVQAPPRVTPAPESAPPATETPATPPQPTPRPPVVTRSNLADATSSLHLDADPDDAPDLMPEGNGDVIPQNSPRWRPHPLPSNLPAFAVVSKVHIKLAADSSGDLFRSPNGGGQWKRVKRQWQGRVVHLAVTSGPPVDLAQAAANANDPTLPGPIPSEAKTARFELMTEFGMVWFSVDGTHWMRQ